MQKQFVKAVELANHCHRSLSFVKAKIIAGELKAVKVNQPQQCYFMGNKRTVTRNVWLIPKNAANQFINKYFKK